VRRGHLGRGHFSQKLLFETEFTDFFLEFPEAGAFGDVQWRLLAGMSFSIDVHPVTQGLLVESTLPRDRGDRPR